MTLTHTQSQTVDLLIKQEEKIAELYDIFSKQFSQHASFWKELSLAEVRHAKLLKELKELTNKNQIIFDEGKLTANTLHAYLLRLDGVLLKAKQNEFTLQTALSCAVDYESSLVEKKVFSLFNSSNKKTREVLKILQIETENHVEYIKNIQRSISNVSKLQPKG